MGGKMFGAFLTIQYPLRLHRGGHPASRATLAWHATIQSLMVILDMFESQRGVF